MKNADRLATRIVSAFILILLVTLPACAPTATPTLFHPPSGLASPTTLPTDLPPVAATPGIFSTDTPSLAPTEILPTPSCVDGLTWLSDLTFEDNTVVLPGQSIDKQWRVQNSGSCDWDARYLLRFVGGDLLGAPEEIPLYPARAGAQVTLRIVFTAPLAAGTYQSQWQAIGPDGTLFGDTVYIQIVVAE